MPILPKSFGRRKSQSNALEDTIADGANTGSFKVFERKEPVNANVKGFDGGAKFKTHRPSLEPEDNLFSGLTNRGSGSGGSNTNTISTTDTTSSRISAVSTASSSEPPTHDYISAAKHNTPLPPVPKSSSSKFSFKNTGRAFSFGRNKSHITTSDIVTSPVEATPVTPSTPIHDSQVRPSTIDSYASTTTSPKVGDRMSLGGDFSQMFAGIGNRKSAVLLDDVENAKTNFGGQDDHSSVNMRPPQQVVHRKPLGQVNNERLAANPYASPWNEIKSEQKDRLIYNTSPANGETTPPPVPEHHSPVSERKGSPQRPGSNGELRRSSAITGKRHSLLMKNDVEDEDARVMRESIEAMRHLKVDETPQVRKSWTTPAGIAPQVNSPRQPNTANRKPKAVTHYPAVEPKEDNLFDSAQLASQWIVTPSATTVVPPKNKVMTPAQFEKYRQEQERLKSIGGGKAESEADEDDAYEDEEVDEEKLRREQADLRKKQAKMLVHRQTMMKITGETNPIQRPPMMSSSSTPNLGLLANDPEPGDDDEDVPLAILQAHGFPNKKRAPGLLSGMSSNPNLRGSYMGGVVPPGTAGDNRSSVLPAFARRLPQDPYNYNASIVNPPPNRESLAFGAGSQGGGSAGGAPGGVPGGLVGVIVSEERSRALRRGSPNVNGEFAPMPQGMMMGQGMGMNMGRGLMGGAYQQQMPMMQSVDPMMQAQMAQVQAQQQHMMEMQMQFFSMMAGNPPPMMPGMPGTPGTQGPGSVYGMPPSQFPRTSTMGNMGNMAGMNGSFLGSGPMGSRPNSRPGSAYGVNLGARPHTVADPNLMSGMRNSFMPGYAGSIAPSERSNVGLAGRYRPVSHMPLGPKDSSRTSTMMSGGLNGWGNSARAPNGAPTASQLGTKPGTPTVRILPVEAEADEDEEKEWEEMKKKKEKKKSIWRSRKKDNNNDLGDFAHLAN